MSRRHWIAYVSAVFVQQDDGTDLDKSSQEDPPLPSQIQLMGHYFNSAQLDDFEIQPALLCLLGWSYLDILQNANLQGCSEMQ